MYCEHVYTWLNVIEKTSGQNSPLSMLLLPLADKKRGENGSL